MDKNNASRKQQKSLRVNGGPIHIFSLCFSFAGIIQIRFSGLFSDHFFRCEHPVLKRNYACMNII